MRKVVFEKPFAAQANVRSGAWEVIDKQRRLVAASLHEEEARMIVRCVNAHEALVERVDGLERALLESLRYSDAEVRGISVVPKSAMSLRHYCNKFALTLAKETT